MTFQVREARFRFRVKEALGFAPGKAGNTMRGAFGYALQRRYCAHPLPEGRCGCSPPCFYQRIFDPAWPDGPSGFGEPPRCFVLRAYGLDGKRFERGEEFEIPVPVFTADPEIGEAIQQGIEDAGAAGIGMQAARLDLLHCSWRDATVELGRREGAPEALRMEFVTPCEVKEGGRITDQPAFGSVFRRVRDRISAISQLYQGGLGPCDFPALGVAADRVRTERSEWKRVAVYRKSTGSGKRHPIGGTTGSLEVTGDFRDLLGWLEAGTWTGVGRQTVWGKGTYVIHTEGKISKNQLRQY